MCNLQNTKFKEMIFDMTIELREYSIENSLEQDDIELMNEFFDYDGGTYICDAISEIADSNVGIYNEEILKNTWNLYSSGAYEEASVEGLMGDYLMNT
jgi:hypothetical protein